MLRFAQNIRITRILAAIVALFIVTMLIIGMLSYSTMNSIKSNQEKLYHESLIPFQQLSRLRQDFLGIRLNITKAVYEADNKGYLSRIDSFISSVDTILDEYKASPAGALDKEVLYYFSEEYDTYMDYWTSVRADLLAGNKISADTMAAFTSQGEKVEGYIEALESSSMKRADIRDTNSDNRASRGIILFIIVEVASVTALLAFSLFIVITVKKSTTEMIKIINRFAEGDLRWRDDNPSRNEFGTMKKALGIAVEKVSGMLNMTKEHAREISLSSSNLSQSSEEMTCSSQEVAEAIQQVAAGSSSQAEDLTDIRHMTELFNDELEVISEKIQDINKEVNKADLLAGDSSKKLERMLSSAVNMKAAFQKVADGMQNFSQSINRINQMTAVINDIADQTNLLALNAAIEAARAGESGKGFSVVAEEIRKLAEQSKISSSDIREIIESINDNTCEISEMTGQASNALDIQSRDIDAAASALNELISSIDAIHPMADSISELAKTINSQKGSLVSRISNVAAVAEQASASAQQIAASSEEMSAISEEVAAAAQIMSGIAHQMQNSLVIFKI